jgi:hypothetical protein
MILMYRREYIKQKGTRILFYLYRIYCSETIHDSIKHTDTLDDFHSYIFFISNERAALKTSESKFLAYLIEQISLYKTLYTNFSSTLII